MSKVVLSEDEAAIVERGAHATALLDHPSFLAAIDGIRAECAENILTSAPSATSVREDNYNLSRGLSAVTERLMALAAEGEATMARAEAETAQQEPSDEGSLIESTHDQSY